MPPLQIRDDLEDYFRRLDERLSRSDDGPADVPRFGFSCVRVQRARMCSGANFMVFCCGVLVLRRGGGV